MFVSICASVLVGVRAQPRETFATSWDDALAAFGKVDLASGSGSSERVKFDEAAYTEAAMLLPNGSTILYALPPFDSGYFITVDLSQPAPLRYVELYEPIGAMQCDLALGCFGHRILDDLGQTTRGTRLGTGVTGVSDQMVQVDMHTGDIQTIGKLKGIYGYSIGASALDVANGLYYGVMVGNTNATMSSNQYLVTFDLAKGKVTSKVSVDMYFMGPLIVDGKHGLITFGSSLGSRGVDGEKRCLMAKVDPSTGDQVCFWGENEDDVPVVLAGAAAAKDGYVLVNDIVGPNLLRLLTLDIRGDSLVMVHNVSVPIGLQSFAFDPSASLLV